MSCDRCLFRRHYHASVEAESPIGESSKQKGENIFPTEQSYSASAYHESTISSWTKAPRKLTPRAPPWPRSKGLATLVRLRDEPRTLSARGAYFDGLNMKTILSTAILAVFTFPRVLRSGSFRRARVPHVSGKRRTGTASVFAMPMYSDEFGPIA